MIGHRSIVATALVLSLSAARASAQRPGDELPGYDRARQEYLLMVLADVKTMLGKWRDENTTAGRDRRELPKLLTDDALFSPVEGWTVQGRDLVRDSLVSRFSRIKGYYLTLLDFTASGSLAFCMGRLAYQLDENSSSRPVAGTFTMVLWLDGHRWRVRSYLEREER
jgi:ketosteroid isomerase-like protein